MHSRPASGSRPQTPEMQQPPLFQHFWYESSLFFRKISLTAPFAVLCRLVVYYRRIHCPWRRCQLCPSHLWNPGHDCLYYDQHSRLGTSIYHYCSPPLPLLYNLHLFLITHIRTAIPSRAVMRTGSACGCLLDSSLDSPPSLLLPGLWWLTLH